MVSAYSTILTPVDFSVNTDTAICKSMDLANREGAVIYLLHVLPVSFIANDRLLKQKDTAIRRLKQKFSGAKHIKAVPVLAFGDSVQDVIAAKAFDYKADLIVVGKRSTHILPFLNTVFPVQLAEQTGKPVLMVKPGAANARMKTVVVPVGDKVPYEKMNAIGALCQNLKLKVHLVMFVNGSSDLTDYSASSLLHVYQWLKNSMVCQVEYALLRGNNRLRSLINYSEDVDADLLLLYPGAETYTGWLKRPVSDVLPASSKLQVLAVQPQNV